MRAVLLAIVLFLAPGFASAQPSPTAASSAEQPLDEQRADPPQAPPMMKNAGELRMESQILESGLITPFVEWIGLLLLIGVAALSDLTAGSTARRVPLRPMLTEAWGFLGRYWRRAPGPAVLVIPVAAATVSSFLKAQGFLSLLGLVGVFLLMVMAMAAAVRLAGQDLEPDRTDFELGPFGFSSAQWSARWWGRCSY